MSQNLCRCISVSFQHLTMDGINARGLATLLGFNGSSIFSFSGWVDVYFKDICSRWGGEHLAGLSGSGRLSTSWKCFTHLAVCLRCLVKALPFLSLTGAD